jgi:glucose-6-phosphate isomerase, archaeal
MSLIFPFQTMLDFHNGALEPRGYTTKRYLQDMLTAYADSEAITQILQQEGNRLIYEVQGVNLPEETGQVLYGTTTIYPGLVGEEFHMTKGHFHRLRDRGEFYMGLAGQGYVLLETEEGQVQDVPMQPGAIVYVPPLGTPHHQFGRGTVDLPLRLAG